MLKRLGSLAALAVGFSLLTVAPASAATCGLLNLLPCSSPTPAPSPTPTTDPAPAAVTASSSAGEAASVATTEPVAAPSPAPAPADLPAGDVPEAAARLLELVNQERAAAGLVALQSRDAIVTIALGQSQAMADRGDIWHNNGYFTSSVRTTLAARALGENVAMNGSLEDAHRRLMASPGHRANILNGAFDAVGIAVVRDSGGTLYVTQDFVDTRAAAQPTVKAKAKTKAKASKAARRSTTRRTTRSRSTARR